MWVPLPSLSFYNASLSITQAQDLAVIDDSCSVLECNSSHFMYYIFACFPSFFLFLSFFGTNGQNPLQKGSNTFFQAFHCTIINACTNYSPFISGCVTYSCIESSFVYTSPAPILEVFTPFSYLHVHWPPKATFWWWTGRIISGSGFISSHLEEGESLYLNWQTLRLCDNAHNHGIVEPMRMLASSKWEISMYSRSEEILQWRLSFHISWRMTGIPRGIPKQKGLNQTSKTEEREQKM
jgi:hypothetical protein